MSNSHSQPTPPVVYFVTGTSRGLGLEFATQLLESSPSVHLICAARDPAASDGLMQLIEANADRINCVQMDVGDEESVKRGAEEAKSICKKRGYTGIDVLINNAGTMAAGGKSITETKLEDVSKDLQTNLIGPIAVAQSLLPLLEKGNNKTIINISSALGSIGSVYPLASWNLGCASYSITKAALNMFTVKLARELEEMHPGSFLVLSLHPGYVKTDMSGGADGPAEIHKEDSVKSCLQVVGKRKQGDTGKFYDYKGEQVAW